LEESEIRYRRLFEAAQDGILILDSVTGIITDANPYVTRMLGYREDGLIGKKIWEIGLFKDTNASKSAFSDLQNNEYIRYEDLPLVTIDGRRIEVEFVSNVYWCGPSKVIQCNIRDIMGRKRSERLLLAEKNKAQQYLDIAGVITVIIGADQKVELVNKKGCEILGYDRDAIIGKNWFDHFLPKRFHRECRNVFTKLITGQGEVVEYFESPVLTKSGAEMIVAWHHTVIRDGAGKIVAALSSGQDITEKIKEKELLKQAHEELEMTVARRTEELFEAHKALSDSKLLSDIGVLAATVAHELRNPLAAIKIAAYNLRRKIKSAQLDGHLINIEKKIDESDHIINNLLFYSKIKKPQYEKLCIFSMVKTCMDSVRKTDTKKKAAVKLKANRLKNLVIDADAYQMGELFSNILNNAVEAVPKTKGRIQIDINSADQESVTIEFADNGAGIDAADLQRVFEPFFTTKAKGTGLGMAVCQQIINLHRGSIYISSEKGRGTTVTVVLPRVNRSNGEKNIHSR